MNKTLLVIAFIGLFLVAGHASAAAAAGGAALPWDNWWDVLLNSITGKFAFFVSVMALVGCGCALAFGGSEIQGALRAVIYIFMAIAFIIAARNFLAAVTGQGAEIQVMEVSKHVD